MIAENGRFPAKTGGLESLQHWARSITLTNITQMQLYKTTSAVKVVTRIWFFL